MTHDRYPVCQQCFSVSLLFKYAILAVVFVGEKIVQLFQAPKKEFSCLKMLFPRDISCELVKGVFPGSFLLCLTTVHNK